MDYYLVNAVSKRRTKMLRKSGPSPQKYNQRLCGGAIRLTRGKHFPLSAEAPKTYQDELLAKQNAGAIEVRVGSPMGPIFDFATLEGEPEPATEVVDAPPEPESPHDETEAAPAAEVEAADTDVAEVGEPDFGSMTNKELVALILDVSTEWDEKELKKMKKSELLELLG